MVFYLKEGQNSIFCKVKVSGDECVISKTGNNTRKIERTIKKLHKKSIKQVVLSKKIKKNKLFVQTLENYDIAIIDGKWLMQYLVNNIIDSLNNKRVVTGIDEITILTNELTDEVKENIRIFIDTYKKIRIVTNHLEKFKKFEQEIFEETGISIIITNNKKNALLKSKLIVNFDFVQENINQYNIHENATIINLSDKIKINKKRFNGIIITDYEVEFQNKEEMEFLNLEDISLKKEEFELKEILEEKIYYIIEKEKTYNKFRTVEKIIQKYNIEISKIYGINGPIN